MNRNTSLQCLVVNGLTPERVPLCLYLFAVLGLSMRSIWNRMGVVFTLPRASNTGHAQTWQFSKWRPLKGQGQGHGIRPVQGHICPNFVLFCQIQGHTSRLDFFTKGHMSHSSYFLGDTCPVPAISDGTYVSLLQGTHVPSLLFLRGHMSYFQSWTHVPFQVFTKGHMVTSPV